MKITEIEFNPFFKCIWVYRGRIARQYPMTFGRVQKLWKYAGEWNWRQEQGRTHLTRKASV